MRNVEDLSRYDHDPRFCPADRRRYLCMEVFVPWPLPKTAVIEQKPIAYTVDPATGIPPIGEWGGSCGRGFVSDSRFGSGTVIKRTNRQTTRKWHNLNQQTLIPQKGQTTK